VKTDLTPYTTAILTRFRPAEKPEDATHRFSTTEVREAIKELNPAITLGDADVFDAMQAAGFSLGVIEGSQSLRFQWLMVEK
jgi:hypothetical protein